MRDHNQNEKENEKMKTRKEKVDALLRANSAGWTEDDRGFLMEADDALFTTIEEKATEGIRHNAEPPKKGDKKDDEDEDMTDEELAALEKKVNAAKAKRNPPKANASMTVDEHIASLPPEVREVVQSGLRTNKESKALAIKALKDSGRCPFTDAQLEAKTLDELRGLVQLAAVPVDFSGAAPKNNADDGAVPEMPDLKFG